MLWLKRSLWIALAAGVLLAIVWAYLPKPVAVELGEVTRGPFELTVTQPGRTRVKDRFTLAAPVGGRMLRAELHAGDRVKRGDVLARMVSLEPPLLDARTRAQAQARVRAAEAAREQAASQREQAQNLMAFARTEASRQKQLAQSGSTPPRALEVAELDERSRSRDVASAEAALQVASYELDQARAALGRLSGRGVAETAELRAPIAGVALRVLQESEAPVAAGTPLFELGDLSQLEAVVDLLTQDAVRVQPGARVAIERWGGAHPLTARVRRVEPSAFTKISALGVEEQRVNVVVDLESPPPELGDGFRVECRITLFAAADVLQAPAGALFRAEGGEWMMFATDGERLRLKPVVLVEMSDTAALLGGGVAAGERVVLHPGDKVRDGVKWQLLSRL